MSFNILNDVALYILSNPKNKIVDLIPTKKKKKKKKKKQKKKKKTDTHTQSVWAHLNGNFTRIPLNLAVVCTKR